VWASTIDEMIEELVVSTEGKQIAKDGIVIIGSI
jgi:hypothetical protein